MKRIYQAFGEQQRALLGEIMERLALHENGILRDVIRDYRERYPGTPETVANEIALLGRGLLSPFLRRGKVEALFENVREVSRRLCDKKIPYLNVSCVIQTYEDHIRRCLRRQISDKDDLLEAVILLDELCHGCLDAAASTYLRPKSGRVGRRQASRYGLTRRESEVLRLVTEGYRSREIAQALDVSVKTVEHHRASIKRKLGVSNVVQMVRRAMRQGFVQ